MDGVWPLISGSSSGACHALLMDASRRQRASLKRPLSLEPRATGVWRGGAASLGAPMCQAAIAYDRVLFILPAAGRARVTGPDLPVYTLKGLSGRTALPRPMPMSALRWGAARSCFSPNFMLPVSPPCLRRLSAGAGGKFQTRGISVPCSGDYSALAPAWETPPGLGWDENTTAKNR